MRRLFKDWPRQRDYILSLFKSRPSVDIGIDIDDKDLAIIAAFVAGFVLYIVTVNSI